MKKKLLMLMLSMALMTTVACGKKEEEVKEPEVETPAVTEEAETGEEEVEEGDKLALELKAGFVTDEGGIHDASFNQSGWEGMQEARDLIEGLDVGYLESHTANDYAVNFEQMLDEGNQIILGAGFKLGADTLAAAQANPEVNYVLVDESFEFLLDGAEMPKNLLGVLFNDHESSFLVGYIAGKTTQTDKVGFVGGMEGRVISAFEYGYKAGVDYAAKELGKEIEIFSQYVGDFSDAAKGKSIANSFYQDGADIVFHASGGAGAGVIGAAIEQGEGYWAIGVDRDQIDEGPDNVLTSAMKRVDIAVKNVLVDLAKGEPFPGGTVRNYGLQDDGAVDIAPSSDKHVAPEILDEIPGLKDEIIAGNIVVPNNAETYEVYKAELNK
ncbi:MAG: BMP family ABC transporter substrate-binding protein [Tissierellia bacterium]|nr:BMP family ABC transporter substrate-binding protein [Tissierellia bacterium]